MKRTEHIAIIGGSASGKTRLAEQICGELGGRASRLCLDDFYRDLSRLGKCQRESVNFDDPAAIDWDCVSATMEALTQGRTANLPVYDFATHTRGKNPRPFAPGPVVIWDGLWLMHPEWLRGAFRYSIFVECSAAERFRRRLERDVSERGRLPESVRAQFFGQVEPMHAAFVEPQKGLADCVVTSPVDSARITEMAETLARICGLGAVPI